MSAAEIYRIRPICAADDRAIEQIIRACLIEYGGNHSGTAWEDENLGRFSSVYRAQNSAYWVLEDAHGTPVGGVGIGALDGVDGVCELQKMYCLPQARGTGAAQLLMQAALDFAAPLYHACYLETLHNMTAAQKFYEKNGFRRLKKPLGSTAHFACDVCYLKPLRGVFDMQLQFDHVCIQTNDYDSSLAFYCDVLGMQVTEVTEGFHGRAFNTWLARGAFRIELQTPKQNETFAPFDKEASGITHLAFQVENLEETLEALQAAGAKEFLPKHGKIIYEVKGGKLMKLKAPEGTILEFRS